MLDLLTFAEIKFKTVHLHQFWKTLLQENLGDITPETNILFKCQVALFGKPVFKRIRSSHIPV